MNIIPIPKHTICLRGKYEGSKTFTVSKDIFEKFSVAWKTFKMDIAPANAGEENVVFLNNPLLDKEECELGCADGGDVKVEFEFLMDVVIGAANAIGVKYYGDEFIAPDVKALEKRHEAIWTKCNKLSDSAYEIIGRYNKFKEYIG